MSSLSWAGRSAARRPGRGDLRRDELGVVLDPAEQGRPARVLPREAEEVEPGDVGHASTVLDPARRVEHLRLEPGVVEPVARRPDHRVDVEHASVREADRAAARADDARPELDPVAALELPRLRPDQRVAALRPAPDPAVDRLPDQARLRQPPEQVAAEDPLRQRRLTRADREVDLVRRRELLRDLVARVPAADHGDRSRRDVARPHVAGAVRLEHLGREPVRESRHVRHLERSRRDDDLVGRELPVLEPDDEVTVALRERAHRAPELDRKLERGRVLLEVGDHLVTRRIAVRLAGKRQPGQRVVAAGREEEKRVPAAPPGGPDRVGGLEDHEPRPWRARK